jgi:CcmD family protein
MDLAKWQNLGYLFWAYTFIWALLAGYLFILAGRMRRLRRELDELRRERSDTGRL